MSHRNPNKVLYSETYLTQTSLPVDGDSSHYGSVTLRAFGECSGRGLILSCVYIQVYGRLPYIKPAFSVCLWVPTGRPAYCLSLSLDTRFSSFSVSLPVFLSSSLYLFFISFYPPLALFPHPSASLSVCPSPSFFYLLFLISISLCTCITVFKSLFVCFSILAVSFTYNLSFSRKLYF